MSLARLSVISRRTAGVSFLNATKNPAASLAVRSSSVYTERMNKTGRPISPHITVYAWPFVTLVSGTTRATGFGMCFLGWGIGLGGLAGVDTAAALTCLNTSYPMIALGAKSVVAFPLIFHYMAGLRHLWWDKNPAQLTNEDTLKTSVLVAGAAATLTAGACMVTVDRDD